MGAIIDALSASVRAHGGEVMIGKPVASIRSLDGQVRGVVTRDGEEYEAPIVVSAISPHTTVTSLVDDTSFWGDLKPKMKRKPMRGRAFKVVLALDGMPRYAAAKSDEEAALSRFGAVPRRAQRSTISRTPIPTCCRAGCRTSR